MNGILYFFRDKITGIHYIMYAFVCFFLMFSIIGYLFKQKYAKLEIKLNTSKPQVEDSKDAIMAKNKKKEKHKKVKVEPQIVQTTKTEVQTPIDNQNAMGLVSTPQVGVSSQPTATQQPVINQPQQVAPQMQTPVASQPQTQVVQPNVSNNTIQKK